MHNLVLTENMLRFFSLAQLSDPIHSPFRAVGIQRHCLFSIPLFFFVSSKYSLQDRFVFFSFYSWSSAPSVLPWPRSVAAAAEKLQIDYKPSLAGINLSQLFLPVEQD